MTVTRREIDIVERKRTHKFAEFVKNVEYDENGMMSDKDRATMERLRTAVHRRWLKRTYGTRRDFNDRYARSLREDERIYFDESGETWKSITILPECYTKEDVIDYCDGIRIPRTYSQYDCTGKPVTMYIETRQVACGTIVIHCVGLDI